VPFIIAAFLYLVMTATLLAGVGVVSWAYRGPVGRALLGGAAGSAVGFVLGCGAAVLVILVLPGVGARVGATALVALASLGLAAAGMAAGTAVSWRAHG
jgi:hypothetical protein